MRSVFFPRLVNDPFGDPALYVRLAHRREALLFDCGDLHPLSPREALKVRAVFLSHAHIDHLNGFDQLLRLFLYQDADVGFYGPPGITDRIAGRLSGYTWNLIEDYPLALTVFEMGAAGEEGVRTVFRAGRAFRPEPGETWRHPGGRLRETGYCRVRGAFLDHGSIPSLAFVLEEPLHIAIHKDALERYGFRPGPWLTGFKDLLREGAPEAREIAVPCDSGDETRLPLGELAARISHREPGMKIVYVTDAAPSRGNLETIAALAAEAHLLAIEAPFLHADLDRARQRHHLTARLAGETARRAGAARLLVFHHSPRYQHEPERLRAEAEAAFRGEE